MRFRIFSILLVATVILQARPMDANDKRLGNPPPRIIRTCCSFGVDVRLALVPFVKYSDISGPELIGPHKYLGSKQEGNGIIYTHKGGFVDVGHLRDQADWTAFLYNYIKKNRKNNYTVAQLPLGYEGGAKHLIISIPQAIDDGDLMVLAGRIAYDLSVWHEIGTWNGTSLVPLLPEKYSAFSIEDGYSNLMGVLMGIEALKSDLPFEEAMTTLLKKKLEELDALPSKQETYLAMMKVEGHWWDHKAKLPSIRVIKKREFNLYPCVYPFLLDDFSSTSNVLCIPELSTGDDVNKYYKLEITINNKFDRKLILTDTTKKTITQKDFPRLIAMAQQESEAKPVKRRKTKKA